MIRLQNVERKISKGLLWGKMITDKMGWLWYWGDSTGCPIHPLRIIRLALAHEFRCRGEGGRFTRAKRVVECKQSTQFASGQAGDRTWQQTVEYFSAALSLSLSLSPVQIKNIMREKVCAFPPSS
jgi:hypothetical protein